MISKLFSAFSQREDPNTRRYRELIRREAQIGGQIFGPLPEGGRREFFCLDRQTWVWHEEWTDAQGVRRTVTTRYDIRPHGIFKAQDGQPYQRLTRDEAIRFRDAMLLYRQMVHHELYAGVA